MCGFVTVVRTDSGPPIDREALDRMRDSLAHRGPDDATTEIVDDWVGLGFRRLAIIDVVGAKQPLRNEDGQVVCTFNGEIYNFVELRNRLLALGHTFATSGDGEVMPHMDLSHLVMHRKDDFDKVIGDRARRRIGNHHWNKRLHKLIGVLETVFAYDHLYLGGGNSRCIKFKLPRNVTTVSNDAGMEGGAFAWTRHKT